MEYLFNGLPPTFVEKYFPRTYNEELDKRKTFAEIALNSIKNDLEKIAKCFQD